ncbi:MAG: DUF4424 family protein [Aeromonadaceae bacterium]
MHLSAPLFYLIALLLPLTCWANDSTPRSGAGGITLLQSADIRMAEEELTISPTRISVRYRFENESDLGIDATLAFPMPRYSWTPGFTAPDAHNMPMSSFLIRVNDVPVQTERHRHAMLNGQEITTQLRAAGLSDRQLFDTFADASDKGVQISDEQQGELSRIGALQGRYPNWQVAETRTWQQHFPARTALQIEHQYQPWVGTAYDAPYQQGFEFNTLLPTPSGVAQGTAPAEACVDEGTRQAVERRIKKWVAKGAKTVWVTLQDVEYVLGTGGNWKGPIGDFTLTLEKESPDQLVSLCFPGKPQRQGKKSLVFKQRNYTPQDKLVVYFYTIRGD